MTPLIHWVESNIGLTVTIITTLIAPLIYYVYIVNRIYDFEYYFLSFRERFWLFIAVVIFSIIVFSILTTLTILTYLSTKKIWTSIVGFIITIIYFILGYFTYALLYALTGSTVSKPEDIQSANTPVAILAVIGFYLSYFTMMNPTSSLNVFASMFPFSSPFCMPFRIMMGIASSTDVLISIAILIVTILIIAKVAIKIYSNAILNYGTKMTFKDMVKMYKDKNN